MGMNLNKSTSTEYQFVLNRLPNNIHDMDELRLNIYNITLPGVSLNQQEMPWQGKHAQMHLGGVTFDPLNINYLVDSEFKNWRVLFNWIMFIADNKEKPSADANSYVVDGSLLIMDNFNKVHTTISYKNLWIQTLGELSFSIRDGESFIESSATMMYDYYEKFDLDMNDPDRFKGCFYFTTWTILNDTIL